MTNQTKFAVVDEDGYIVRVWNDEGLALAEAVELERLSEIAAKLRGYGWGSEYRVTEVTATTVRGDNTYDGRTRPLRITSDTRVCPRRWPSSEAV